MIKINFLGPIGLDSMNSNAKNFKELKNELSKINELKEWLPLCAVSINNKIIQDCDDITFNENDIISLLPPVSGG